MRVAIRLETGTNTDGVGAAGRNRGYVDGAGGIVVTILVLVVLVEDIARLAEARRRARRVEHVVGRDVRGCRRMRGGEARRLERRGERDDRDGGGRGLRR